MATKYGKMMSSFCKKSSVILYKHIWLYYLLSFTWGIILTFFGLLISFGLLIFGKRPKKYERIYYFEVGKNWGGFEMGLMFVANKNASEYIKSHEYGHTYQNAILGPLYPVLVGIPSAIRCDNVHIELDWDPTIASDAKDYVVVYGR